MTNLLEKIPAVAVTFEFTEMVTTKMFPCLNITSFVTPTFCLYLLLLNVSSTQLTLLEVLVVGLTRQIVMLSQSTSKVRLGISRLINFKP